MAVDLVIEDARWKTLELKQIANQAFFETLFLLDLHHKSYACCVLACDNRQIKQLNNKFRGKNCPTNVLSFPASLENYETYLQWRIDTGIADILNPLLVGGWDGVVSSVKRLGVPKGI